MPNESSPLGDADLVELKDNLVKLDQAEHELEKAVRAGLDMGSQKTQIRELRGKLTAIKQSYFPGK